MNKALTAIFLICRSAAAGAVSVLPAIEPCLSGLSAAPLAVSVLCFLRCSRTHGCIQRTRCGYAGLQERIRGGNCVAVVQQRHALTRVHLRMP